MSDDDLLARQAALQDEARQVLAGLDLAGLVADVGPMLVTGSFVSGLMCWRELDVMVHAAVTSPPRRDGPLARIVPGWGHRPTTATGPLGVPASSRGGTYPPVTAARGAPRRWPHIYTAVLDDGIRTVDEFAAWLAQHGLEP